MMPDYPLEQTLYFKFTTRAFATGIPTVLAGSPVVEIYEDDSVTQITAAETLTVDFDSVVGLNHLTVVATAANGFESGKSYSCVISVGTVGGVSVVGEVVAEFSIERSPALRPTTAGRTLTVEADGDLAEVNTLTGHTVQTGDSFARIGAAGASLTDLGGMSTTMKGQVLTELLNALEDGGQLLVNTTIATLASQVSFTLTAGSADNDAYNGAIVVVEDATTAAQKAIGLVDDYIGASKTIALQADPGIFTMAVGDKVRVLGLNALEIVKAVHDRKLTAALHNIATSHGRRIRTLQDFGVYEGGAVWVDTVNGTAGTTDFENGTVNNPVASIADARTIADSVNLVIFHTLPGSSFTLAQEYDGFEFRGFGYTVALGGQSVSGASFADCSITGNDDGTNALATVYMRCTMNSNSLGRHRQTACTQEGDLVLVEAADYFWDQCISAIAGTGTPSVDFEAAAETKNLSMRHHSGGIEFKNLGAGGGTHQVSLEGHGQYIFNANCVGGTLKPSGHFDRTDNAGGAVTLVDRVNFETILDDGTTIYDRTTDSLQEIRDNLLTQANAALDTAIAELGVGQPTATPTVRTGLMLLYMKLAQRLDTQTSGTDALELYNAAGTLIAKKLLTDDGADYSEARMVSG